MQQSIYLDYAATTPVDKQVSAAILECLTIDGNFANPTSGTHALGLMAADAVERSRYEVADLVNCQASEIIFTSGATESDNLAIHGVAMALKNMGKHIITVTTEHKAVLETCQQLEKEGFTVTYLQPQANGLINLFDLETAITDQTILVSIMHVNNELGIVQDIEAIGNLLRSKNIFFHVDAAQSAGKIAIDLSSLPVDLMSFSAHKLYGPKGIGALYINRSRKITITPLMFGGGQERNIRSGTLATHQIVGMGKAFTLAKQRFMQDKSHIQKISEYFCQNITNLPNLTFNTDRRAAIPHIVNFRIEGIDTSELLSYMSDIAVSVGSACNSRSATGSHVLRSLGLNAKQIRSSLRVSFGRYNTIEEIDQVISRLKKLTHTLLKKTYKGA